MVKVTFFYLKFRHRYSFFFSAVVVVDVAYHPLRTTPFASAFGLVRWPPSLALPATFINGWGVLPPRLRNLPLFCIGLRPDTYSAFALGRSLMLALNYILA